MIDCTCDPTGGDLGCIIPVRDTSREVLDSVKNSDSLCNNPLHQEARSWEIHLLSCEEAVQECVVLRAAGSGVRDKAVTHVRQHLQCSERYMSGMCTGVPRVLHCAACWVGWPAYSRAGSVCTPG